MNEPLVTHCPSCGVEVHADPELGSIACLNCGHVFSISHNLAASPSAPAQKIPRWGLITLTASVPFVLSIMVLYATFGPDQKGAADERAAMAHDYLAHPEAVPEQVRRVGEQVRRVTVTPSAIEVYDGEGRHHLVSGVVEPAAHDELGPVSATSFTVDEIDFAELPKIVADASARSGGQATEATVEVQDDAPIWRIRVQAEGGTREQIYSLDGELRRSTRP